MCFSKAPALTTSFSAIARFERPSAIRPSTSRSRGVSPSSAVPRADALHGLDELAHVGDAVLEEVAEAGLGGAGLECGAQTLVGEGGGHAHVDDREVGVVLLDDLEQLDAVARGGDDVEAFIGEEPLNAGAQEDGVLGDDHAHGTVATSCSVRRTTVAVG